jgi:2-methylisocitrate lyase-like PEP mutase family enzyme
MGKSESRVTTLSGPDAVIFDVMSNQIQKAEEFRALHVPGQPFVLFNIWDPGTAKAVTAAGARAVATGSWSVAAANGFADGEHVPLDLVIGNLARIVAATALPVSVDIESGYGKTATEVGHTIGRTIEAGAIGCNLEDSFPASGKLRDRAEQAERIGQARAVAMKAGVRYFINARTDVFLQAPPEQHDHAMLDRALDRAGAYADSGADGIFVPGLVDQELISRFVKASPRPVNIMVSAKTPSLEELARAGVARVSHGPGPYRTLMKTFEEIARAALSGRSRV